MAVTGKTYTVAKGAAASLNTITGSGADVEYVLIQPVSDDVVVGDSGAATTGGIKISRDKVLEIKLPTFATGGNEIFLFVGGSGNYTVNIITA